MGGLTHYSTVQGFSLSHSPHLASYQTVLGFKTREIPTNPDKSEQQAAKHHSFEGAWGRPMGRDSDQWFGGEGGRRAARTQKSFPEASGVTQSSLVSLARLSPMIALAFPLPSAHPCQRFASVFQWVLHLAAIGKRANYLPRKPHTKTAFAMCRSGWCSVNGGGGA